MKIINPSTRLYVNGQPLAWKYGIDMLKAIERIGRTCYKSEDKITDDSYETFVRNLIKRGHLSVIEHCSVTADIICDRGITHEIVRHRIGSYSQESTRYCNYSKEDFGKEITFIIPSYIAYKSEAWNTWKDTMKACEDSYFKLLDIGLLPQEARAVLPNSLKTELVMTANLREWKTFFKLRTAGAAHPQMREVARPLLDDLKAMIPGVFDDITY
jgi:thymidylate synthase (FAD)